MNGMKLIWLWLPPLALMAAIWFFVATSSPDHDPSMPFPHFDKLQHFGAYGTLCALFFRALAGTWNWSLKRVAIVATALASLYGAIDEVHQYFMPGRVCDIVDWLFDGLGAVAASLFLYYTVAYFKNRTIPSPS